MLVLIQLMKLFMHTGQGELTDFMGGDSVHNLHSMCQGNGAALASWMALSLFIVRVYNRLGSGKKMCTSMKRVWRDVAGVHCADDTDLFSIDACLRSPVDIGNESPASLTAWG